MTEPDFPLPPLREDLQMVRGGTSAFGAPVWVVLDPLASKFFRVTFEMFQLLSLWNLSPSCSDLKRGVEQRFGRRMENEEVAAALGLLEAKQLVVPVAPRSWKTLHGRATKGHGWFRTVLHGYLSFKLPIVRPEPFIRVLWPSVSWLFSRGFLAAIALLGLCGLYLVSRQWETFAGTFPYVFTPEGVVISFLSIAFLKLVHECGHALMAHRQGCRVSSMGIAVMMMTPLPYTDVTDSWRLTSRRKRLLIDGCGVAAELCVASVALFLWAFFPDGPVRSAMFVLASTAWVLSLAVNLNPLMRFDGYYMMADLLGVENLQTRAFQHMLWRMRRLLFGLDDAPPESLPPWLDLVLTVYAIATAVYRLILYVGIALVVYHFAIKIVGVALFVVEVGVFLVGPVHRELKEWWAMRHDIVRTRRSRITLAVAAMGLAFLFAPLSTRIEAPAILRPSVFLRLFPAEAGRIERLPVREGQAVRAGDILLVIDSPVIAREQHLAAIEISLLKQRLARIGADPADLEMKRVSESRLATLMAKRDGLLEREAQLVVRAPQDGVIRDLDPKLSQGVWVGRKQQLLSVSGEARSIVDAYLGASDRARVAVGNAGVFVPDDMTWPSRSLTVTTLGVSDLPNLAIAQLVSTYGGKVAVHPAADGRLQPVEPTYALSADVVSDGPPATRFINGAVLIDGEAESLASRLGRQVLKVLVREAGF